MSYAGLEIGKGGTASRAFEALYFEEDAVRVSEVRRQLLAYCATDTLAMVKIFGVLGSNRLVWDQAGITTRKSI